MKNPLSHGFYFTTHILYNIPKQIKGGGHAPAGVDQLLLSGIERMALGADFNLDIRLGGAGLDDLAARTADGCGLVVGMESLFHFVSPRLRTFH